MNISLTNNAKQNTAYIWKHSALIPPKNPFLFAPSWIYPYFHICKRDRCTLDAVCMLVQFVLLVAVLCGLHSIFFLLFAQFYSSKAVQSFCGFGPYCHLDIVRTEGLNAAPQLMTSSYVWICECSQIEDSIWLLIYNSWRSHLQPEASAAVLDSPQ